MPRQRIYFAGELFDHKHLAGNALLAAAIEAAEPNYECVLPQLMEQPEMRAESIRNHDLLQVLSCDLALFNFDGTELDSGTVVEFMYAKFLDKPCVILRSDFRAGGDQEDGDPWNLMCSFYPRTETVLVNGMAAYHDAMATPGDLHQKLGAMHDGLAQQVVDAFAKACQQPSTIAEAGVDPAQIQKWAQAFAGKTYQQLCEELLQTK